MKYNLSEITDVIKNRRTIYPKFFSSRKVHKEIVEHLLNNATWAPTHGNTQPWKFQVYMGDSREKLSKNLGELYQLLTPKDLYNEGKFKKISSRPFLSSVAIVVSMKRGDNEKIPEIEEVEAVACAIQNMCLTATAYGLGSFWSSPKIIYTPEMNKFLKLKPEDKCLGVLYVGYPSIDWPKGQRKPIEYLTEWNE
ncbi:MAG: nitroreductase [Flavobacteriales bacterium]|jgi:nitroreductase|nr:nitroreductase [Flavobacteriales bacterium]MDG1440575.1 nitroreductase [Flavobacteriales bacterium]MDG1798316.1 nitroreductase [Flavobacteriales bacterium]